LFCLLLRCILAGPRSLVLAGQEALLVRRLRLAALPEALLPVALRLALVALRRAALLRALGVLRLGLVAQLQELQVWDGVN
jgi:hypothetical protein